MKPVIIIAIIFSITIVLAGIGIAAMSGAVETLPAETLPVETLPAETFPVTTAHQMNGESDSASFLVESYIQKESEETSTPLQNYVALQHEKAANRNSLFIDIPKGVNAMWVTDSILFDPKVHDYCSELFPTFDLLGVDKFRIMYAADGAAQNCLVRTSEELEARAESIAQQLEAKLLEAKLTERKLLEAKSAADNVETHNAFKSDSTSNSPAYNSPAYNSPAYNSPAYNPSVEPKNANPLGTITINTSPHFSSFPEITKKNLNSPSFNVGNFDQPSLPPSLPPVYDSPRTPEPAYNPAKEAARSGIGQNSQPAYSAPYVPNPFLIEK